VTVLDDSADKDGVDIVGDARDPTAIRDAGIDDASAVIVTSTTTRPLSSRRWSRGI